MSIKNKEDLISSLAIDSMNSLLILQDAFEEHVKFTRQYVLESSPESISDFDKNVENVKNLINLIGWK